MRQPKEISIDYSDLLNVISALKNEAKSYRDVKMKDEADKITKTRKIFEKVERSCKLHFLKISY